jgi:uroporphyrinogen decarboxylase
MQDLLSRQADFHNLARIFERKRPERPTLFEFAVNFELCRKISSNIGNLADSGLNEFDIKNYMQISAYRNLGYDYSVLTGSQFSFKKIDYQKKESISLNEGNLIHDRSSFTDYPWPDPDDYDNESLQRIGNLIPDGMKLIICSPLGVLENVLFLTGYERLCYLLVDDYPLAADIFNLVGERLLRHFEIFIHSPYVGGLMCADDWGYKTQTMIAPRDLYTLVFPWHKRFVHLAHEAGKYAILHSCGKLDEVMPRVIKELEYDAKHSYDDTISPIEVEYEKWHQSIAVLGGIGIDFIVRESPQRIQDRCEAMLEQSRKEGSYALGSGNSIPPYVPTANYLAMLSTILDPTDIDKIKSALSYPN